MLPEVMLEIAKGVDNRIKKFLDDGGELDDVIEDNLELIKRAQNYFDDHGVAVITALFHASLPEAYLASAASRCSTSRASSSTTGRGGYRRPASSS